MSHWCRICDRSLPNERFSGRGHRDHICKQCKSRPKAERDAIDALDEIFNFLHQSHISTKNIARLEQLIASENHDVAGNAKIVLEVAKVTPYKKRRLKKLAEKRRDLIDLLEESGLILAHGGY